MTNDLFKIPYAQLSERRPTMKYFAFLSLLAFGLATCSGPQGPPGPMGPQGIGEKGEKGEKR